MLSVTYFKALADETRLRLVNLLMHHELNVNEIVKIMEMGQSRISRHLKILSDSGLLKSRRDGSWIFYSASKSKNDPTALLLKELQTFFKSQKELVDDLHALEELLKAKANEKTDYFNTIAKNWDVIKKDIIGDLPITEEIISALGKMESVADLGCGTGHLLPILSSTVKKVIGVDKSENMLVEARKRFPSDKYNIDLRIGDIEHLPIRNEEVHSAIINMVLHHLESPSECLLEVSRIIIKGGIVLIIDLEKHENEKYRKKYGHRWLGFSKEEMTIWLKNARFKLKEFKNFSTKKNITVNLFIAEKK